MGSSTGTVRLVPAGPNRTRLDFVTRFHLTKTPRQRFERPINRKNEAWMRGFSQWLVDPPGYRADPMATEEPQ